MCISFAKMGSDRFFTFEHFISSFEILVISNQV